MVAVDTPVRFALQTGSSVSQACRAQHPSVKGAFENSTGAAPCTQPATLDRLGRGTANDSSSPMRPARFASAVLLSKDEVFRACEMLAGAGSALVNMGYLSEGAQLSALFDVLEGRLTAV